MSPPREKTFEIGDRVRIDYGAGTVVDLVPDAAGQGRPELVVVLADIGQAWFRDPSEVEPLDEEGPRRSARFKLSAAAGGRTRAQVAVDLPLNDAAGWEFTIPADAPLGVWRDADVRPGESKSEAADVGRPGGDPTRLDEGDRSA